MHMSPSFPDAQYVRAGLRPLTMKQIDKLAALSGVAAPTIYKIKRGEIVNPGVETVAKFWPHLAACSVPVPHVDVMREGAHAAGG